MNKSTIADGTTTLLMEIENYMQWLAIKGAFGTHTVYEPYNYCVRAVHILYTIGTTIVYESYDL